MSKTLLVGIDVHSEKNSCGLTDDKGNRLHNKAFSIPNNLPGAEELERRIEATMKEGAFDKLMIATEASSFLRPAPGRLSQQFKEPKPIFSLNLSIQP